MSLIKTTTTNRQRQPNRKKKLCRNVGNALWKLFKLSMVLDIFALDSLVDGKLCVCALSRQSTSALVMAIKMSGSCSCGSSVPSGSRGMISEGSSH